MEIDYWYDKNTLFNGIIEVQKDSIPNEFGSHPIAGIELKEFSVIQFIGGIDYDLTSFFEEKYSQTLEHWKKSFLRNAWEKYAEDLELIETRGVM